MYLCETDVENLSAIYKDYIRTCINMTQICNERRYLDINNHSFSKFVWNHNITHTGNNNTLFYDIHYLAPINSEFHGKFFKELQKEVFKHDLYLVDESFINDNGIAICISRKYHKTDNIECHNLNIMPFLLMEKENSCNIM